MIEWKLIPLNEINMAKLSDEVPAPLLTVLPYIDVRGDKANLIGTECGDCGFHTFPPSTVCPSCMSLNVRPLPLSPVGKLYSFTTIRHAKAETFGGYVDFPENVRVFGHLGGFAPDLLPKCDMQVRVVPALPVPGAVPSLAPIDFNFVKADPL